MFELQDASGNLFDAPCVNIFVYKTFQMSHFQIISLSKAVTKCSLSPRNLLAPIHQRFKLHFLGFLARFLVMQLNISLLLPLLFF